MKKKTKKKPAKKKPAKKKPAEDTSKRSPNLWYPPKAPGATK